MFNRFLRKTWPFIIWERGGGGGQKNTKFAVAFAFQDGVNTGSSKVPGISVRFYILLTVHHVMILGK